MDFSGPRLAASDCMHVAQYLAGKTLKQLLLEHKASEDGPVRLEDKKSRTPVGAE